MTFETYLAAHSWPFSGVASSPRVHLTEDHIRRGRRNDPCQCPFALALLEHYRNAGVTDVEHIEVMGSSLRVFLTTGDSVFGQITDNFVRVIRRYDETGEMEPQSFDAVGRPSAVAQTEDYRRAA